MPAYAIAHLRNVDPVPAIARYLDEIDATLEPHSGRFLVHGGTITVAEGDWPGTLVVIEFPDRSSAEAWYASVAYQAILPLRTANAEGAAIIVDGVRDGHRAKDLIAALVTT